MLCGKIAAGKSTLAAHLARAPGAVLIAEDRWLKTLYGSQMTSVADYMRCAERLRGVMGPHVAALLSAGTTVVLDFQANTVESRVWMRGILDSTTAGHQLHLLQTPDALCLERLRQRNARGDHPFTVTEAQFNQIARHFAPPTAREGFTVVVHEAD